MRSVRDTEWRGDLQVIQHADFTRNEFFILYS